LFSSHSTLACNYRPISALSLLSVLFTGASVIAEVLQVNSTLQTLSIGGNNFGNKGIMYIAQALTNSNLKELRMWRCGITCGGTKALAQVLRKHCTLKRLDLSGNDITLDGAHEVLSAAVNNETCEMVNINNNYCNGSKILKFISTLKRRQEGMHIILIASFTTFFAS